MRAEFGLADAPLRSATQLGEQLSGLLAAGIALTSQEPLEALRAQATRVGRARVALKERQRDPAVQIGKQPQRTGPEPLQLGPQLVCQRRARPDQIRPPTVSARSALVCIAVRLKHPEAMMIGTRQLAQHERVKAIRLPARGAKPRTRRGDLVGVQRQHPQPRV